MVGALSILLVCVGIYLLLRSQYENLSVGRYIGYSLAVLICGVIVLGIAFVVGRNLRGVGVARPVINMFPGARPVINRVVGATEHIIELNADDLDPQIQEALLTAARRRVRRRQLTTADILNVLEKSTAPQDGTCGVCYDGLDNGELLACPECHKIAHRDCLETWIESGQNVCIYCRHDLIPA